jgi:16S rRNA (uracil1498-N3)-methyltransferase
MSYFITSQKLTLKKSASLSDDDVAHILFSRRAKVGEIIHIQDAKSIRYSCTITEAQKKSVTVIPNQILETPAESPLHLSLFQAYISEQSLDLVIQKSTELGVYNLVIFNAKHSPQTLKPAIIEKKLERWRKIALEAAKQSDRTNPVLITFANTLEYAIAGFKDQLLVAHNSPKNQSIGKVKILNSQRLGIIIGPEGGLTDEEIEVCITNKAEMIGLGPRILRAETASITAISVLQARFGDLS